MTPAIKFHIKTITKEELVQKIKNDPSLQIINVLDPKYHDFGSIKGSKKIPLEQLNDHLGELDKNREVVTYCTSYDSLASRKAAEYLAAQGFRVNVYEGGIKEWKVSSLPME